MTAHPTTGDSVGGYVLGRLGGGAMGLVFEGRDPVLQQSVAIKVISPELAEDPEFRARFTREAQAQAAPTMPPTTSGRRSRCSPSRPPPWVWVCTSSPPSTTTA